MQNRTPNNNIVLPPGNYVYSINPDGDCSEWKVFHSSNVYAHKYGGTFANITMSRTDAVIAYASMRTSVGAIANYNF